LTRIVLPLLLLGAAWGAPAGAAVLPEVAVVGVHIGDVDTERGERLAEELVASLELSGRLDGLTPDEVSSRLRGREELVVQGMAMRTGRDLLRSGRLLYERAQPDQAIPELQRATRALAHGALLTGETKDLIDAWLVLGLAEFGMGNLSSAQAAWRQVAILAPDRELDPLNYPPKVIQQFDGVRAEVAALEVATLEVLAGGGGARVLVDGRSVGTAPVQVTDLAPGSHFVYAVDEDGRRAGRRVVLEEGGGSQISFAMDGWQLGIASAKPVGRSRQTKELYQALGEHCQADLLLLAGLSGEGFVSVQLYSPRSGNFSKTITAEAMDEPVAAVLDLVPAVAGYVTESGDIRSDRVSLEVASLDVTTNALLTRMLLDTRREAPTQPPSVDPPTGPDKRWLAVAGVAAGGAVLGGGGIAIWAVLRDGTGEPEDNGTISMELP